VNADRLPFLQAARPHAALEHHLKALPEFDFHPARTPHNEGSATAMQLNEAQQKAVAAWIADGLKLSEIQNRLAAEFGARLTYMEVRLLVDDLKLKPKDPEPPKPPAKPQPSPTEPVAAEADLPPPAAGLGGVSVTVDQLTRPGALASGKVTFSDGMGADWYLDQTGRLGLVAKQPGYKPVAADVQQFQMALEREMAKLGY
jgi:hypothetical protein